MSIYVVQPGDNVDGVSFEYGVLPGVVIADNQLVYPYTLAVGQALFIRDGMTGEQDGKSEAMGTPIRLSVHGFWNRPFLILRNCLFFLMVLRQQGNLFRPFLTISG